jgi:hypothetical protein
MSDIAAKRPEFSFTRAAFEPLSDYDAVMAFELFLGRSPESSAVIDFHKSQSFPNMMAGCLASSEFADNVILPMRAGQPIRRGDYRGQPSREQRDWLAHFLTLDDAQRRQLDDAQSWSAFFRALHLVGGVELLPDGVPAAVSIDPIDDILKRLEKMQGMVAELQASVRELKKEG